MPKSRGVVGVHGWGCVCVRQQPQWVRLCVWQVRARTHQSKSGAQHEQPRWRGQYRARAYEPISVARTANDDAADRPLSAHPTAHPRTLRALSSTGTRSSRSTPATSIPLHLQSVRSLDRRSELICLILRNEITFFGFLTHWFAIFRLLILYSSLNSVQILWYF